MSEYITIQVGQCGNQIGSEFWPLALKEYSITEETPAKKRADTNGSIQSFFQIPDDVNRTSLVKLSDLTECNVKARAVLIDMECGVISRIQNSKLRNLFDSEYFIVNYPGSGNNWAEGYCGYGPTFKEDILRCIKKAVEKCDSLHGFVFLFSDGGGTGSGLGTYVLKLLADEFPHIDRIVVCVYPTGTEDVITCPYNMCLATKELIENASCVIPIENRALQGIVDRLAVNKHSLETMSFIAKCKPFQDMNSLIVNLLLNLTSGSRFSGNLNLDLSELSTNLVPFSNLQFLAAGMSPLTVSSKIDKTKKRNREEVFLQSCNPLNQFIKPHTAPDSVILSCALLSRGNFTISDLRSYVDRIQKKYKFTVWSSRAVKIAHCDVAPFGHDYSMLTLFNTTGMANLLTDVKSQFVKLYSKKAHLHHYTQVNGFERSLFTECLEVINSCICSYTELQTMQPINASRLEPNNLPCDFNM